MEFFIYGLSLGSVLTFFFERRLYREGAWIKKLFNDNRKSPLGYHFHHSAVGLFILLVGLLLLPFVGRTYAVFLIGMGLGIIAVHTDSERKLVFLEKEKKRTRKPSPRRKSRRKTSSS